MAVVWPDCEAEKVAYRKWSRLYPGLYVGVCRRGCHGEPAGDYEAAAAAAKRCQFQCDEEAEYGGGCEEELGGALDDG